MKNPKSLKKSEEFQRVYTKGRSYANKLLVLYVLPNEKEYNRYGISISKKVGNSVKRHHLARLIRENLRLSEDMWKGGFDMVAVVRVNARDADYHGIESALRHLAGLHGLYKEEMEHEEASSSYHKGLS